MELTSPTIGEITKALVKAQKEMPAIQKRGTNPRFKSKYAKYDDIRDACVQTLCDNGLIITQHVWPEGEMQCLVTRLNHTSGEWMQSKCVLPIQEFTSQNFGSAMTYCKRYTLEAILMLAGDDDDGEAAEDNNFRKNTVDTSQRKQESSKIQPLTEKKSAPSSKFQTLKNLVAQSGVDVSQFEAYMTEWAAKKNMSVEAYCENALINPDITQRIGKKYAEELAKKSAAA